MGGGAAGAAHVSIWEPAGQTQASMPPHPRLSREEAASTQASAEAVWRLPICTSTISYEAYLHARARRGAHSFTPLE